MLHAREKRSRDFIEEEKKFTIFRKGEIPRKNDLPYQIIPVLKQKKMLRGHPSYIEELLRRLNQIQPPKQNSSDKKWLVWYFCDCDNEDMRINWGIILLKLVDTIIYKLRLFDLEQWMSHLPLLLLTRKTLWRCHSLQMDLSQSIVGNLLRLSDDPVSPPPFTL